MPDLRLAITTASFLPWTAVHVPSVRSVFDFAARSNFAGVEVLVTRAVCRAFRTGLLDDVVAGIVSSHEVWNPRDTLRSEIQRILGRIPQSRGMVPYPMDCLFFANGDVSENVLFGITEKACATAVVSQLESPVTGERYASARAAVQVHCDMGPGGTHVPLEAVAAAIVRQNYAVVLDTNHVRRRARMYVDGHTEIAPPVARPGEISAGGIARVWKALGNRVSLVHFQPNSPAEFEELIRVRSLPPGLDEFREILPELAERQIPIVLEISPPIAGAVLVRKGTIRSSMAKCGVTSGAMQDALCRVRDCLARDA